MLTLIIDLSDVEEEYKDDSIGSAGSLANRSVKSSERVGQPVWEEEDEDLSGIFAVVNVVFDQC